VFSGHPLFVLYSHKYAKAAPRHFSSFLIPKKIPYLNQVTQKNTCQILQPKKIPESKISNPKKSFDHPRHFQAGVPPLGVQKTPHFFQPKVHVQISNCGKYGLKSNTSRDIHRSGKEKPPVRII